MIEFENAKTRIFCPCPPNRDWYWPCSQSCFIIIYNILSIQFQELPTPHFLSIFLVLTAYILVHWRCLFRGILQQIWKHLQRHSLSFAAWKRRKITFFIISQLQALVQRETNLISLMRLAIFFSPSSCDPVTHLPWAIRWLLKLVFHLKFVTSSVQSSCL